MKIQPYSKKELALAYAPSLSMSAALGRLSTWINSNPDLLLDLERSGYHKHQRLLTSYQVRLIFDYLGEP